MLKIDTFVLGELATNCYLLTSNNLCWLVDPADDYTFLSDSINERQLILKNIILTHGHYDHCLAASFLQKIFNTPVSISFKDKFLLNILSKSAKFWQPNLSEIYIPPLPNIDLEKNTSIDLNGHIGQIISTPGHTPGSVSLYIKDQNILFTGDTLFASGIGRTDLSYSSPTDLKNSLKKIFKLPKTTTIYPGHGQAFLLADLL